MTPSHQILVGDCLELLRQMPDQSVHCCVTSPPYFGLRDYGVDGQIGLEETPAEFITRLVEVFREVRRVLRDDGTCWVNMGDSYATGGRGGGGSYMAERGDGAWKGRSKASGWRSAPAGLKHKDLMGMPWRLAFALQDDGWYLRQDIIWHKPNPMPESIRDRCTKAHEYLFLLSKSRRYYFDQAAISEPLAPASVERLAQEGWDDQEGRDRVPGKTNGAMKAVGGKRSKRYSFARETKATAGEHGQKGQHRPDRPDIDYSDKRNKRSVWSVATVGFKGAHFATFPPDLIRPCILAGAPRGGLVLDPFGGAGTTGLVAMQEGRLSVLCELNPGYAEIARARLATAWIEGAAQLDIFNDSKKIAR
ncbi:site-specific DNA-methyltransferase [Pseudomonas sp. DY-1]|uniref:DNA-methyltransferase n=1 Tax=Pseudomonas sp. DY-1 TaxID=1755504 RepID=UPI000EAA105A|nr:site-specific DNA-methyltransferase [Pseudomonas sp. DY-1]AYF87436.1 site-specific DNA-methyltransferase [Pseudomonas sp. DY-1]